eukprot:gnl/MRDRNA2_/MRDRNA2_129888_c0_seq1.p1 gnl/MRDRNA2_/MRDRNA2_129888_c0~~gnl/MRDRNA2_/MRDRNA2_129888_c0_seq1.p1  ORF type:complete len:385 (+),score=76.35 gnl/MRDRNA2_/MRDRNA2_129888_c0_seq1:118-1272(+)
MIGRAALKISSGKLWAKVLPYGATITELYVPDCSGEVGDVLLGFKEDQAYSKPGNPCFNCVIGRTAGRIGPDRIGGQPNTAGFTLDGVQHILTGCDADIGKLNPHTNLHGGPRGFDKVEWKVADHSKSSVRLEYVSADGDQGFPGELRVALTYSLEEDHSHGGELRLHYEATTTKPTPVSLTNHAYFNLSAGTESTVRGHDLQLNCPAYNPDNGSGDGVPTGEKKLVEGTGRDLTKDLVSLASVIDAQAADSPQWPHGEQFVVGLVGHDGDPNAVARMGVLNPSKRLPFVGLLSHEGSGREMEVFSSEPVCQTYYSTLLALDSSVTKNVASGTQYGGICLEMHRHANAVNVPEFPSNVLRPTEVYNQITVYKFFADPNKKRLSS